MTFGGSPFDSDSGLEVSGFDDTSPLGSDVGAGTGAETGDLAAFLTTGDRSKLPAAPTAEQQREAQTQEVQNLLASPFEEDNETPEETKPAGANPWLDELLGEPPAPAPKQAQEAQQPADPTPPPAPQIDPELLAHMRAGGNPEDFYRQKFAAQPQTPVSGGGFGGTQPAPTQPAVDPEVAEIQTVKTALTNKMRENYLATMKAQQFGTQDDVDALVDESIQLQMQAGELASRERSVLQRTRQTQVQSVQGEYATQFTEMLKRNHGVSDEARLRAASGKVLEVPWLQALMGNEKTFPLMQNEVVREIMVKAALYDMQYSGKRAPRQAASDPGVTQSNGATNQPAPQRKSGSTPGDMSDKDFASFITGGKKK